MLKECLQSVTSPRNCKDAMVTCEPKDKLTLDQDGKEIGPLCEIRGAEAKGLTCKGSCEIHDKDSKGLMCTTEAEDCSLVQVHALVVDDMFVDRKIVERLVKSASFNVTAVDSGAKALAALSGNNNINLILTDYCMPEMSGYDLLKHVKELPTLKDIPVVIMSSENVPDRIQRCLEEGAEEFLLKPVRLADVKRLRSYVFPPKENLVEQKNLLCKKRKFNADGFQVQSPERTPRLGRVTVA